MRKRTKTSLATVVGGGLLFGTGTCVPDNFWVDLGAGVAVTAVDTVVADALDNALNPDAPLEVDLVNEDEG